MSERCSRRSELVGQSKLSGISWTELERGSKLLALISIGLLHLEATQQLTSDRESSELHSWLVSLYEKSRTGLLSHMLHQMCRTELLTRVVVLKIPCSSRTCFAVSSMSKQLFGTVVMVANPTSPGGASGDWRYARVCFNLIPSHIQSSSSRIHLQLCAAATIIPSMAAWISPFSSCHTVTCLTLDNKWCAFWGDDCDVIAEGLRHHPKCGKRSLAAWRSSAEQSPKALRVKPKDADSIYTPG